jgi:putative heme transporter
VIRKRPVTWGREELVGFRSEAIGLLRRRWHVLTIATLASQLAVFVVFVVVLRPVGVTRIQVTIVEAFAAWSLTRVLGSIPITPGGSASRNSP